MLQFVSMLSLAFIVVNDQSRGENHTVVVYGRSYSSARGKLLLTALLARHALPGLEGTNRVSARGSQGLIGAIF